MKFASSFQFFTDKSKLDCAGFLCSPCGNLWSLQRLLSSYLRQIRVGEAQRLDEKGSVIAVRRVEGLSVGGLSTAKIVSKVFAVWLQFQNVLQRCRLVDVEGLRVEIVDILAPFVD